MKILIPAFVLVVSSCSDGSQEGWRKEVVLWEQKGWSVIELLGVEDAFLQVTFSKSETAKIVNAVWVENMIKKKKSFTQIDKKYLVVTFHKANGDSFVVVMNR